MRGGLVQGMHVALCGRKVEGTGEESQEMRLRESGDETKRVQTGSYNIQNKMISCIFFSRPKKSS